MKVNPDSTLARFKILGGPFFLDPSACFWGPQSERKKLGANKQVGCKSRAFRLKIGRGSCFISYLNALLDCMQPEQNQLYSGHMKDKQEMVANCPFRPQNSGANRLFEQGGEC